MIAKPGGSVVLILVGLGLFAMTGCSGEARKAGRLERAEEQSRAGQFEKAEIEYLGVLRLDPTNRLAIRGLGIMAYQQGRIPRAFTLLSQARELDTNDLPARLYLGLSELALGGRKEAREEAVFVLAQEPTNGKSMLLLVDSSVGTNDLADAWQRLEAVKATAAGVADYHLALGTIALRRQALDAAADAFQRALVLDPNSSVAHASMANLYLLQGDRTRAEKELKTAADLAPPRSMHRIHYADYLASKGETNAAVQLLEAMSEEAPDYVPALLRQAQLAFASGQYPRCEGLLASVRQRDQTNLEAMELMAQLRAVQGDLDEAIAELDRAIKEYPRMPGLYYRKALTCLAQNGVAEAERSLSQALTLQPEYPSAELLLAQIHIRTGRLDLAVRSLTELIESQPNLASAQLLLASAYRMRGDLDDALNIYEGMAQTLTNPAQPVFLAGLVQRQQGKDAAARRSFERALEWSGDSVPILQQLVGMDMKEKDFAAAQNRMRQAVTRNPGDPQLLVLQAQVYLAETNQSDAEATLVKALELAPDLPEAQQMLANIYVASNRYQDALRQLQEVVSRNPNDIATWSRIAYFQTAVSNYSGAKASYEKALAIDPKSRGALNNLAGLCAEHLGDLDQAYELATKARATYPVDPFIADTLGWVCYLRGDYGRALTLVQQSAEKLSEQPDVLFHLGRIQYGVGDETAAKVSLQSALRLAPEARWRAEAQGCLEVMAMNPDALDPSSAARLEQWLVERPNEVPVLMRIAVVRERDGSWDQAAAAYQTALQVNPDLIAALLRLAQINSSKLNKPQQALDLLNKANKLAPGDPKVARALGVVAFNTSDYRRALYPLQESARGLPNDPEVHHYLAVAYLSLGRIKDAQGALQLALKAGPNPADRERIDVLLELLSLLQNPGNPATGRPKAEAILQETPDYLPARMMVGLAAERQGDVDLARSSYDSVLSRCPEFVPVLRQMTILLADRRLDDAKAYECGTKAREYLPDDADLAGSMGAVAFRRGDYLHAAELLRRSLDANPNNATALFYLGLAQSRLEINEAAEETLKRALELAPDHPMAPEAKRALSTW